MRLLLGLATAAALLVAVTSSAWAHNMTVTPPGTGEVKTQWIGGPLLPAQAEGEGLFPSFPSGLQPAAHREGLPNACEGTESSPAVSILAPPFFTGCVHGLP